MGKLKKYKIARRLGASVFDKCQTQKFAISQAKRKKDKSKHKKSLTDYGFQLLEKQKVKVTYGLRERQFANYVKSSMGRVKGSLPADRLYEKLENRLDNVVYRSGLADTRQASRQQVSHGHFLVNKKRVTIPSYQLKIGDLISIREGSRNKKIFENMESRLKGRFIPSWIKMNAPKLEVELKGVPKNTEGFFDLNQVIEFYSR